MLTHPQNGWFQPCELMRAAVALIQAPPTIHLDAHLYGCKYIQLYVDQRTKSFLFRSADGVALTEDQVYALFPSLRDNAEIVSAGVRPYPE